MSSPVSPNPPILVALGADARSLRLVHAGFRLAREQGRPWVAVHVQVPGGDTPEEADQARVWLQEAEQLGARALWVKAPTVVAGLLGQARALEPCLVVLGETLARGFWDRLERSRAQEFLRRDLGGCVRVLPLEVRPPRRAALHTLGEGLGILAAVAVILVLSGIFAAALSVVAGFGAIPAVFALTTGFMAHRWGRTVSTLASLLALGLFAATAGAFGAAAWPRILLFAASMGGSQMLVDLVGRLRQETRAGRRREAETLLLMLLGRALAGCGSLQEAAEVLVQRLGGLLQAQVWVRIPGEGDAWLDLSPAVQAPPCPPPSRILPALGASATRVDPLEPLFLDPCTWLPLAGPSGPEAVLQIRLPEGGPVPQETWGLLQAFAVQGSLALDRIRWSETVHRVRMENETERVRSGLLGAVSHDLRTPLAAIQGAATSLLLQGGTLPEATRRDMLVMIQEESERLSRLLSDLLDLTRLETGVIRAHKEWQPLDEVVGTVIARLERSQGPTPVQVELPPDLPPAFIDGVLMEQVLFNLLINARRHAPGTPPILEAWDGQGSLELAVSDRGPGVPEALRARVFDKFFRMPGQSADGGVGLGLAICDAVLKAHAGRIWVEERRGGGARFRLSLPQGEGLPDLAQELSEGAPLLPENGA